MSLAIALVIVLVLLLLTGIGAQRDLQRGALSLAGTLVGVALTSFWADEWGAALAIRMKIDPDWAVCIVSSLLLIGSAVLLGYGGEVFLAPTTEEPSLQRRAVGGGLGLLNATVLIGYLLHFGVQAKPEVGALVAASPLAQLLYNGLPLLFLLIPLLAGVAVLVKIVLENGARSRPTGSRRRVNQAWVLDKINQASDQQIKH